MKGNNAESKTGIIRMTFNKGMKTFTFDGYRYFDIFFEYT